jgi:hypothetical protein
VLLDELSCAPPALQAPLLGLVLDRQIGSYQLGPRVRVMGAANPPEQAAAGWDLAPPLANRFIHLQWAALSADRWADGLASEWREEPRGATSIEAEEARVLAEWPRAWASATATIGGFLRRRPELLSKMPPAGDPAASGAWPSPRSWEAAARLYAAASIHSLSDEARDTLIAGAVGQAACIELLVWARDLDLPDPAALLDGAINWTHDPRRLDRTVAVLSACAALLSQSGAAKAPSSRQERLWALVGSVLADAPDASVPAVRQLVRARLTAHKSARPVLARLQPVLAAAGITP